jgi:uncharacterized protein
VRRIGPVLGKTGKATHSVIDRYSYPAQEMEIRKGEELKLKEGKFGDVVAVSREERTIDVKKGRSQAEHHPTAVFAHTYVSTSVMEESILQVAERVAIDGGLLSGTGLAHGAARDLLRRKAPRLVAPPVPLDSPLAPGPVAAPRFDASQPDLAFACRTVK